MSDDTDNNPDKTKLCVIDFYHFRSLSVRSMKQLIYLGIDWPWLFKNVPEGGGQSGLP